jgi:NADPH:quinone reductase-like Zn-dependent oxidoreductase
MALFTQAWFTSVYSGKYLNQCRTGRRGQHRPAQEEYLHSHGADQVYDYNQIHISDITDTFDVILDLTNVQKLEDRKALLTPTGIFIPAEATDENGGLLEDPQVGYLLVAHGDSTKLKQIATWVSEGKLKAVIDREFRFADYQQAVARLKEKGRRDRIIMSW